MQKQRPRNNGKVIQLNNVVKVNAALIIFGIILLYVIVSIFKSINKETIATYKVSNSNINNNISCTGIALRNEIQVTTTKAGYACYYVRDGEKVRKGSTVCTIDETGKIMDSLSSKEAGTNIFNDEDYQDIRNTISLYKTSYSNNSFYDVYNFKSSIDSKVLELSNEILMQQVSSNDNANLSLDNIVAPESGIITYYLDGYESITPEQLTTDLFDKSMYNKQTIKSGEIINSGSTVFKMIDDENWNIVCEVNEDQANMISEESKLHFTINNSNYTIYAPYELTQKDDVYFLNISLTKYMTDYISERFVNIEIILDKYDGLKIPNTSLVEKEIYKIPREFISNGGNDTSNNKVYVQTTGEDGQVSANQVELKIYKKDDDYCWVDKSLFNDNDVIIQLDTNKSVSVSILSKDIIEGVYIANKGIANFAQVSVTKTGDEFTIVKAGEKLREFDNIIMNSSEVTENQVIY